jgi:glycine betaine/proline transport system permease protein
MAQFNRLATVLKPLLDAMQTMPSFVHLIPAMMLFGLGKVPAVLATMIYAIPPVIRLTNLGIRQVPKQVQEAAKAYGATNKQLLKEVRLPLALPTILAGVNQTTMMGLAMVVIASMIGARGLGQEVLLAINRVDVGRGFEAGISIVILAIVIDRITQGIAKRWQPPKS